MRIGLNGFGRMGRLALRAGWHRDDIEFVHFNKPNADPAAIAHLLEFDSVHGRWDIPARIADDKPEIEGKRLSLSHTKVPGEVPWNAADVDIVIESSGKFRTREML